MWKVRKSFDAANKLNRTMLRVTPTNWSNSIIVNASSGALRYRSALVADA